MTIRSGRLTKTGVFATRETANPLSAASISSQFVTAVGVAGSFIRPSSAVAMLRSEMLENSSRRFRRTVQTVPGVQEIALWRAPTPRTVLVAEIRATIKKSRSWDQGIRISNFLDKRRSACSARRESILHPVRFT